MPNMKSYTELNKDLFKLYRDFSQRQITKRAVQRKIALYETQITDGESSQFVALFERYRGLLAAVNSQNLGSNFEAANLPAVFTTINPFSRIELQVKCFLQWLDLGFEAFTFNYGTEVPALLEAGIPIANIVELGEAETGNKLHGKPVPRVLPVLKRALLEFDQDILLVNSDLYAAAIDVQFVDAWRSCNPLLALTRQDVLSVECQFTDFSEPYLGGLDAFLLPRDRLVELIAELEKFTVSERMAFGVVGWDYMVGAVIKNLGGSIANSVVLQHELHQATYNEISEFEHYIEVIHGFGVGMKPERDSVAYGFHQIILKDCKANQIAVSRAISSIPVAQPIRLTIETAKIRAWFETTVPQLTGSLSESFIERLILSLSKRPDVRFSALLGRSLDLEPFRAFTLTLSLAVIVMLLRKDLRQHVNDFYPEGNKHAIVVGMIRDNAKDRPEQQRLEVAKLFFTELIDYKIFNPRLFNFLVLSCANEAERSLMVKIKALVIEEIKNAA
ncbi:hypothetical protein [Donghicola sp.]|jgi:hypothetical protein|uniref:hypothetical protein n=1 Tax=Donghicola sp. TaxID=1929294 RepID=UPI0025F9DAAC|nr:hypothetical protein [Donghicola sp.]MCT4577702.1 hypothetical protein [Donghicola sp.]